MALKRTFITCVQPPLLLRTAAAARNIGLESLQNFTIECVKCCCLILSAEQIEGYFRPFAIITDRAFVISLLFLELQHFKRYERMYERRYQKLCKKLNTSLTVN